MILEGKKQEDLTKLRFREKDSGEVAFLFFFFLTFYLFIYFFNL